MIREISGPASDLIMEAAGRPGAFPRVGNPTQI